jgi:hypothetical protein
MIEKQWELTGIGFCVLLGIFDALKTLKPPNTIP